MTSDHHSEIDQRSRARRIEGYAQWIADDAQSLADNLAHPAGLPFPHSTAILAEARANIALALGRIDRAIQADHDAHKEPA